MTGYFFDLYPRTNPLGTVIARLTEAQALKYRGEANGAGVGLISLRGDSDDGQLIDPQGLQYIRVREDDETVVGGFFLDNGDFAAINEQNTRLLTFTGAGALSYLDREVMWAYTYHPVVGAQDPFDRQWRLHAQGFGLGDYLGNSFYRALFEALGYNGATGYRTVTPREGEKVETAIPAITIGFDGFEDSDGNPWTLPSGDMTVMVGETLYRVAQRHMLAGLYIEVDPHTFECRAWEAEGHRRDRTGASFGANVVRFSKGQNIKSDANRALAPFIKRTAILSVGSDDTASAVTFPGDVPWHGSILPDLTDLAAIEQVAISEGRRRADAGDTIRLKMRLGNDPTNGFYRPWREVLHDDLATVDSGSSQWDWDEQTFPVAALEISKREAGDWDAYAELGASYASMQNRAFQAAGVGPHNHRPNPQICRDVVSAVTADFVSGYADSNLSPHSPTVPVGMTNGVMYMVIKVLNAGGTADPSSVTPVCSVGTPVMIPESEVVNGKWGQIVWYLLNPVLGMTVSNAGDYMEFYFYENVVDPVGAVVTASGTSAVAALPASEGFRAMFAYDEVSGVHDFPDETTGETEDWSVHEAYYFHESGGSHGTGPTSWSLSVSKQWTMVGVRPLTGGGEGGDHPADTVAQGDETFGTGTKVTACDHAHAHGLLSEDETHYHDVDHIKDLTGITLSDDDPLMEGTADPGTSDEVSRSDHVHPEDDDSGTGGTGSVSIPSIVQTKAAGASAGSITLDATPIAGNSIVLVLDGFNTGQATAVSSTNTTWTKVKDFNNAGGQKAAIWIGVCAASPGAVITVTHPNAFMSIRAVEIEDALTPTLGQSATAEQTAVATITGVTPGNLIIMAAGTNDTAQRNVLGPTALIPVGVANAIVPVLLGYALGSRVDMSFSPNAGAGILIEVT